MEDRVTIRRTLRLLAISAKMDLFWFLRDTKYALAGIAADIVSSLSTVSGAFLIATRFGGIGGMSADEVLFMMAFSTLSTGLSILFGSGNNIHVSRIIGRGQLDHTFIQPLPLGVQLATGGFAPFTGGSGFVIGVILMAMAIGRLHLRVTVWWLLAVAAYQLTTLAIVVARAYLASSMAFYAPVAAEEISTTIIDDTRLIGTFPLSGMPTFVKVPLLTILPEGLLAWFPSLCLLGRPPFSFGECYPMAFALLLSLLATHVFKKGLRHYAEKGSNRYLPFGFRS